MLRHFDSVTRWVFQLNLHHIIITITCVWLISYHSAFIKVSTVCVWCVCMCVCVCVGGGGGGGVVGVYFPP